MNNKNDVQMICNHDFCYDCLNEYYYQNNICPICRNYIDYYFYSNK